MVDYTKTVSPTGNDMIDSITYQYGWNTTALTYGFRKQDIDNNGVNDFSEGNWRSFYQSIFANLSTFTPLTFTETSYETARLNQLMNPGAGGQSSNPAPGLTQTFTEVDINGSVAGASSAVFLGQYSEAWFHEIGHSLGLRHSFETPNQIDSNVNSDTDLGDHYLNSDLYTVMTYCGYAWGEDNPWTAAYDPGQTYLSASVGSYMPIDIAALQHIYGTRANNTGANTYTFSDNLVTNHGYTAIWDTGGIDTIAYSGISRSRINLEAATLQREIGGGGFLSTSETLTGGFLIANGVTIENATGGSNDDILIGNSAANTLTGNAGDDFLDGHSGADRMVGGAGDDYYMVDNVSDVVVEQTNQGQDQVEATVTYTLSTNVEDLYLRGTAAISGTGNASTNALFGNSAVNRLSGLAGDDRLDGGFGSDMLTGGAGKDVFVFSTTLGSANVDTVTDFNVADDTIALTHALFSAAGSAGPLATSAFYRGTAAHDADDRIVYNASTGDLFYDANGNAAGGSVLIAHLATGLALSAADFMII